MLFQIRLDMHKCHNAPVLYPAMQPFATELCFCVHIYVTLGYIWDIFLVHCGVCQMGLIRKEGFCVHGAHKQYSTNTLVVVVAVAVAVALAVAPVVVVIVVAQIVCSHKSVFNPCLLCLTETDLRNYVSLYRHNQS